MASDNQGAPEYQAMSDHFHMPRHIRANLLAGVLTLIPILVVWLVLNFIFAFLFSVGAPVERALVGFVGRWLPQLEPILQHSVFEWFVAVVVALLLLYMIGATASRVIGKQFIAFMESLIARIPFVETIYSASKKLLDALQSAPVGATRVVMVDFPFPGMKVVGLVMRTFKDAVTDEELAAVYVPTTPNPTSGYLEIVPVRNLVFTDMTMDQAMTMIVSGGSILPEGLTIGSTPQPPSPDAKPGAP